MEQPLINSRKKDYNPLTVGVLLTIVLCASLAFMHVRDHARLESLEDEVSSLKVATFEEKAVGRNRLKFGQCKVPPPERSEHGSEIALAETSSTGRKLLTAGSLKFSSDNRCFGGRDTATGDAICLDGGPAKNIIDWIENDSPDACLNTVYGWTTTPATATAAATKQWQAVLSPIPGWNKLKQLWRPDMRADAQAHYAANKPLTVNVHVTVKDGPYGFKHSHFTISAWFN